jgi:hypothetical protein
LTSVLAVPQGTYSLLLLGLALTALGVVAWPGRRPH